MLQADEVNPSYRSSPPPPPSPTELVQGDEEMEVEGIVHVELELPVVNSKTTLEDNGEAEIFIVV